jgi:type VI secretion system secreted protein Hcp
MPLVPASAQSLISGTIPQPSQREYEAHLDLGTIMGESISAAHPNEIEIISFSWGSSNTAVRSAQGPAKGGKPSITEISVVKHIDKASAQIFQAVIQCTTIKTAKISLSKSTGGKKPEDCYVITVTGAYISSMQQSSSGGAGIGTETITINFKTINLDYKIQGANGLLTAAGSAAYDLGEAK